MEETIVTAIKSNEAEIIIEVPCIIKQTDVMTNDDSIEKVMILQEIADIRKLYRFLLTIIYTVRQIMQSIIAA